MKIVEQAHIYKLENKYKGSQILTFFKDLPSSEEGHDGVLCQEVLRALIDRVNDLSIQKPCHETTEIQLLLRQVLVLFETRAYKHTIEKSYAKVGLNVEELPIQSNGHIFDLSKIKAPNESI